MKISPELISPNQLLWFILVKVQLKMEKVPYFDFTAAPSAVCTVFIINIYNMRSEKTPKKWDVTHV